MNLEIPIIVGFDNIESLLDDLKKLQTYKLSEGDEMVLVDIEDVADVLVKHIKAKEKQPNACENTCEIERKSNDMIYKQNAIDIVTFECGKWKGLAKKIAKQINALPSAQQELPIKEKCTVCPHCDNCDVNDDGTIAQPEIIRCKDCEHWDTSWQNDYAPNYHYCPLVDGTRRDDFYCADAERRTDEE